MNGTRLDKWLWAARFYKTRSLAVQEITRNRVKVNGADAKPSREVRVGDLIQCSQGAVTKTVQVQALSEVRGPAPVAQLLYQETSESVAAREAASQQQREAPEPALSIRQGRPTKRDRRELADWNRWSAEIKE